MKSPFLSLLLLFAIISNAQCPYPLANTQTGTTQTFCIGNPNQVINVNNVNGTKFVLVNVVQGFTYNFSVGDVYVSNTENLNVYDATNTSLVFASGVNGASILNWVATFSGQIKIVLSLDACIKTNTTNVSIAIELVNVGNTLDNQNNFGTDNWVGHVYNWLGTSPPPGGVSPGTPTNTFPFDSGSYAGYYTIPTEGFVEDFGGNSACFPISSSGVVRTTINTEIFAVRYKMTSTRPAGCYIATFRGDDGVRLYNDGVLVFNQWQQQSPTVYSNVLIFLDGSADLVLDYYEYQGQNVVDFSLTPFNSSLNALATPINPIVCSGVAPLTIDGTTFLYNGSTINPTIAFQWQSSTDNITFTNIAGATNEDYTPPAITTPTTVVKYYRRVISAVSNVGSCNFPSNSISITTTGGALPSPPTATAGSGATCTNFIANWNAIAGATAYLLDVSTNGSFTSFITGFNALNVGNVTTYSITGLTGNTTYYYRIRAIYACGLSGVSNRITYGTLVVPNPVATAATAIACNQFNANWNVTANATSYTIEVATTIGFTVGTYLSGYNGLDIGNVTSVTITGVTVSPIYYRIKAVGLCGTSGNSNVITVNTTTTTWNGTAWSNGVPTLATAVIINGNYDTTTLPSFDACNVTVNSPFVVNIIANKNVNIQNELNVTTGATFNVQDDASLVQINNSVVNTGSINLFRTTNIRLQDYVYWSSPVENFSLASISTATPSGYIFNWNTAIANPNGGLGNWVGASGNMITAKGYIVRAPNGFSNVSPTLFTAGFVGKPNNGIYTPTIERGGYTGANYLGTNGVTITNLSDNWNLVGNPFPSAINSLAFLTANTNIEGAVRLWTHATLPVSTINPFYNSFQYNYTPNDYIVYNGTATTSGPSGFNGLIAAGQSFLVLMNDGPATTGTVTFSNTMRNKTYDNSQFYRSSNTSETNLTSSPSRIWLDLISSTGEINRTVVGYVEGATQEKDRLFDAYTDYKNTQNFYSLINDEIMIIQGRSIPFETNDVVKMGIKIPSNGLYTIAIATADGIFESGNQKVYLLDKLNNTRHNLTNSPYQFNTSKGIINDRFELHYIDQTLSNPEFNTIQNSVSVFASNNGIEINSRLENIKSYQVYDVLGRTLETKNNLNASQLVTNTIIKNNQALIVKITIENGQVVTKKVVF